MARTVSALPPSGTCAISSPVAGLVTANVRPPSACSHAPLMYIVRSRRFRMPEGRLFARRATRCKGRRAGLRSNRVEFGVPVEIVAPALVQDVRREAAAVLLELPACRQVDRKSVV